MFFSFTLRAEITAASLPLAHADQLVIQTVKLSLNSHWYQNPAMSKQEEGDITYLYL